MTVALIVLVKESLAGIYYTFPPPPPPPLLPPTRSRSLRSLRITAIRIAIANVFVGILV